MVRAVMLVAVAALGLSSAAAAQEPLGAPISAEPSLSIGLAEGNPALITPGRAHPRFRRWRDRTAGLRPRFFRLLVDWSAVQPSRRRRPDWRAWRDGCLRGRPPCAPYRGVGALLRAIGRRQRVDGGWEVVVSPYFAPRWATTPSAGCPGGRRIRVNAYRRFLRSLEALGRREHVDLRYWSPWNEPNHPAFLRPQRSACDRRSPSVAPAAYAELVRAARAELDPGTELLIGELAGYRRARRSATGVVEFIDGLPQDVVCAGRIWAQHAYIAGRGAGMLAADLGQAGESALMAEVKAALDSRGCPDQHRLWITETGAFPGPFACARMDAALRSWANDPQIDAAFQYTVREDPLFRTGLVSERLDRTRPAFRAWSMWSARSRLGPLTPAGRCR